MIGELDLGPNVPTKYLIFEIFSIEDRVIGLAKVSEYKYS